MRNCFLPFYICMTVSDALYIEKWKPAVIEAVLLRNYFEIYGYRSHVSMCTYEGVGATCTSTPSSTLNRWTTFRFLYLVMPKFRCLRPLKVQHTRSSRKSQAARMYVLVLYIQVQIGDAFWSTSGEKEKKKKKKKQKKPSWRISTSYSFRQFDTEYALSSIIFIN